MIFMHRSALKRSLHISLYLNDDWKFLQQK